MRLDLMEMLPGGWRDELKPFLDPEVVGKLEEFVGREYAEQMVYPPLEDLFAAFRLCPPEQARVLILGQDPYHQPGQAHGLCFSVRHGQRVPPSLRNIFKELCDDLGGQIPTSGELTSWARQGVLLLNAVLTVRAGKPGSHAGKGWEHVTDAAIRALNASERSSEASDAVGVTARPSRVVFVLWGAYARRKAPLITGAQHVVLEASHPSPMNARGFLGSRPFSAVNAALAKADQAPVRWN